jgi:hypothetical protein
LEKQSKVIPVIDCKITAFKKEKQRCFQSPAVPKPNQKEIN